MFCGDLLNVLNIWELLGPERTVGQALAMQAVNQGLISSTKAVPWLLRRVIPKQKVKSKLHHQVWPRNNVKNLKL